MKHGSSSNHNINGPTITKAIHDAAAAAVNAVRKETVVHWKQCFTLTWQLLTFESTYKLLYQLSFFFTVYMLRLMLTPTLNLERHHRACATAVHGFNRAEYSNNYPSFHTSLSLSPRALVYGALASRKITIPPATLQKLLKQKPAGICLAR